MTVRKNITPPLLRYLLYCIRFQVLTKMSIKIAVFWNVVPCGVVDVVRRLRRESCDYGSRELLLNVGKFLVISVN